MRIALIVSQFPPKWLAGTEIASLFIARHLSNRGNDIYVITSLDKGLEKGKYSDRFDTYRLYRPKLPLIGNLIFWVEILILIKKLKPQIVHIQHIRMGLIGVLLKFFYKIPFVVWGQGSEVNYDWALKRCIFKLVLNNADAVIALTKDMKNKINRYYKGHIYIIPNGIDLKSFQSALINRNNYGIENIGKIIFVGTLREVKGVKYLIEAIKITIENGKKVKLLIVGDGDERKSLENLVKSLNISHYVEFKGQVKNKEIPIYMTTSDIFVLPSLSEGFPVVVLEAMASGLPIIATRVAGLPEIIEDGKEGFIIDPKNPAEISKYIVKILENHKLRDEISENNRKKAEEFDWERIAAKLECIYLKIQK